MPFIGKQPQTGAYSKLDAITTSATATYNLTLDGSAYFPQSANHLLVSLNGVMQAPQDSFTISGSQITFASALTSSDNIDFIMALGDTLDIGVPSDGSVVTGKLANSAVTAAKIGSGAVEGAMVTPFGRRNLIINGNFTVSQRGDYSSATNLTSSDTYLVDRWKFSETTVSGTATHSTRMMRLDATSSGTGQVRANQIIETQNILPNQTYTLSAYVKSNKNGAGIAVFDDPTSSSGDTDVYTALHSGSDDWERLSVSFTTRAAEPYSFFIRFALTPNGNDTITSGEYIEIKEVQLELGSVATPFEHRSYGEELTLCQRYYYRHADHSWFNANSHIGVGFYYVGGTVMTIVHFPTSMRTQPTLESSNGTGYFAIQRGGTTDSFDQLLLNGSSYNTAKLYVSSNVSGNGGDAGQVQTETNGIISFDAEL